MRTSQTVSCKLNYYQFYDGAARKWVFGHMFNSIALWFYNPVTIRGRVWKKLIILAPNIIRILSKRLSRNTDISVHNFIDCKYFFNQSDLHFSLVTVQETVYKKNIIQVYNSSAVLGFIKISGDEQTKNSFDREVFILNLLNSKGVECTPKVLGYVSEIETKETAFIQSSIYDKKRKALKKLDKLHLDFLNGLYDKVNLGPEYFVQNIQSLSDRIHGVRSELIKNKVDLKSVLEKCSRRILDTESRFSISHGDFTYWNCYQYDKSLFVYDWEYAEIGMPKYLDLYHYKIQPLIYVKQSSADSIMVSILKDDYLSRIDTNRVLMRFYLCYMIILYASRTDNDLREDDKRAITTWCELLRS